MTSFDLVAGESLSVLALPLNAKQFETVLRLQSGDADIQLWNVGGSCFAGTEGQCTLQRDGEYEGMQVAYSGPFSDGAETATIPAVTTFTALRIFARTDATGTISHTWEGISPCGGIEEYCAESPTNRPTTSPTSGPTTSPTMAPTECSGVSYAVCDSYPACFATNTATDFDIAADEQMTVIFVPVNAQDFETTIESDSYDVTVQLIDASSITANEGGISIIGAPNSEVVGSGTYRDMYVEFDGTKISSPLMSVATVVILMTNGGAVGTIRSSWNGVQPCGEVCQCATDPPTDSPTMPPVTSKPTNRPTTSPTSGPTPAPSPSPTDRPTSSPTMPPTQCAEGQLSNSRTYPACFATQSTTDFDLAPGAEQTILFIPMNAQDFISELRTEGDANMVWADASTVGGSNPSGVIIVGAPGSAITGMGTDTDYNGMEVYFSGQDTSSPIVERIESPLVNTGTFIRVAAGYSSAVGSVTTSWNGQAPCGTIHECYDPPTFNPTTSPTTRPTREPTPSPTDNPTSTRPTNRPTTSPTSGPTRDPTPSPTNPPVTTRPIPRPTPMPTDPPVTSRPTFRPTTSPTSGPTRSPTSQPTECVPPMTQVCDTYSACFATTSTTDFDLAPFASQTILFIPLNAQDFVATLQASDDADMVWFDAGSIDANNPDGTIIIGASGAAISSESTGVYQGMEVYLTGNDLNPYDGIFEEISTPRATVGTFIRVVAGANGAIGTVTTTWNGQFPCGNVCYCQMPPTERPTTSPSSRPTTSPTNSPTPPATESRTDRPTTSRPTDRPTTSPTSGPTTSPTPQPTQSPTCPYGTTRFVRAEPACFATTGSASFDVDAGEVLGVVGVPERAKEFESIMQATSGDCDLQLWGLLPSTRQFSCLFGKANDCLFHTSANYQGMDVFFSGDDSLAPVQEEIRIPVTSSVTALRITTDYGCSGTISHTWNGVEPCGRVETYCQEEPTPQPTPMPTDSPVTSRPTYRPTTSPTSGPTQDPTPSPTNPLVTTRPTNRPTRAPTSCEPPMVRRTVNYPACFLTRTTTTFDLASSAEQTVIFVPLNAQNFVVQMISDRDADIELIDANSVDSTNPSGVVIVGSSRAIYNSRGTFDYNSMPVFFSGQDNNAPYEESITADVMSIGTFVRVRAGYNGAEGSVTVSWNGIQPCGTSEYCEMPPTNRPTTSPSSRPTTSPTNLPTRRPTSSRPTPPPTESPTDRPTTSRPTNRPTTSPTSGPTTSPTMEPTQSPTCPEGYQANIRNQPACFATSGTSTFSLTAGEIFPVLGVPQNAKEFEAILQATGGNCDLQLYGPDPNTNTIACILGASYDCEFSSSTTYNGMDITYSGDDRFPPVSESIIIPLASTFTAVRVVAVDDCQGTVQHRWNGIEPCGEPIVECVTLEPTPVPSVRPTTSPTTGPTREPTPSPTNPPIVSPPTNDPSRAPTCHEECNDYVPPGESRWYDKFGDFFTCDYYAQAPTELCTQTGDMFENFGRTAREACCACNGNHDCGRVCDVVLMFKTCEGANSTTEAWPSATICDRNGNCQVNYYLDPQEDILWANPLWPILAGTKYAWRVPTSMFDSYASTVTLTAAQDGVCIEDVWIDYDLVNDPRDPIFLARSGSAEFPEAGSGIVPTVTFDAPNCRAPSAAPTASPTPEPTTPPTSSPSTAPLDCVEIRRMYEDLVQQYEDQEQVCQDTEDRYLEVATRDGCDYGVTCARCDRLSIDTPPSGNSGDEDSYYLGSFFPGQVREERAPGGTVFYIAPSNQIYVIEGLNYRRTCVEYKPVADQYCNNPDLYCAGETVVGTMEQMETAVNVARSQGDGIHPMCPSGCMGLDDTVAAHFVKMEVPDYENICTFNGLYFYKDAASRSRKFTCVAAGERLEVCPAEQYLCVGFDDNTGMKTFGFYDWQAAAVKTALSLDSKLHPFCPLYANV